LEKNLEALKMSFRGDEEVQGPDQFERSRAGIWVKPHFLEKLHSLEKARGIENWPQLGYHAGGGAAVPQKSRKKTELKYS